MRDEAGEFAEGVDAAALPCPLCGYDLRATAEGRCPECGHAFERAELRRRLAERGKLGWFVESDERRWFSGWRTSLHALLPLCFWKQVDPTVPLRPGRLIRFWVIGAAIPLVALWMWQLGVILHAWWQYGRTFPGAWRFYTPYRSGPYGIGDMVWESLRNDLLLAAVVMIAALPLGTLVTLAVFQQTLRRANIRGGHLLRVALYGNDPRLLGIPAFIVAFFAAVPVVDLLGFGYTYALDGHVLVGGLQLWTYGTYRVIAAHVNYLKLPQPIVTALLVQAVPLLLILILTTRPW